MLLAGGVVSFKTKSRGSRVVYVGWPELGEVPELEHILLLFCLPIPEKESKLEKLQKKLTICSLQFATEHCVHFKRR